MEDEIGREARGKKARGRKSQQLTHPQSLLTTTRVVGASTPSPHV